MKKITTLLSLSLLLLSTSCATIVSGSKQRIEVNSTPANSTVYIDNKEVGKTPYNTKLKRNQSYSLKVTNEGYLPYQIDLQREFNAWFIGNIAIGGLIGIIVDPITGAMYKLKPVQYNQTPVEEIVVKVNHKDLYFNVGLKKEEQQ
ncbi:PEGA domain-containing protein [Myroides injenensis]|uniref:PEGA domain-containing protein n=1 Tax=Myroides injenensis TaxID=1183151 RepID=UPI00226DB7DF|nr:PEGA domain-containing protein [Myroides injenensis]